MNKLTNIWKQKTKYLSFESVPHSFEYEMFPHRLWLITETAAPFSPGDKLTNIDTSWRHHHHGWWRWRPQTFSTFTPTIASPSPPPMGDNGWWKPGNWLETRLQPTQAAGINIIVFLLWLLDNYWWNYQGYNSDNGFLGCCESLIKLFKNEEICTKWLTLFDLWSISSTINDILTGKTIRSIISTNTPVTGCIILNCKYCSDWII